MILAVDAPVLHKYVEPPVPVNVALDPLQMMPSLGVNPDVSVMVISATGKALTVKLVVADGRQFGSAGAGSNIAYIK